MRALVCEKIGTFETDDMTEALRLRDWPMPEPGAGQVRIAVQAAGVNFPDTLMVEGRYHVKAEPPFIPGSEVAGVINAVGPDVQGWQVGDRVCAMTVQGAFAEQVVVDAANLVALPDTVDFATGSALLMTYGTAIHALHQRARLMPGERMLVLGAGGGVSLAAVALGAAMGAQVVAAASSAEKRELARQQGAQTLIDNTPDAIRGAGPYDVIFDPVGGDLSEIAFRAIAPEGRHLVIGFASGTIPAIPLNLPLLKSAAIMGVFWGAFTKRALEMHRANMADVLAMLASGAMPPPPLQVFALSEGPAILRRLAAREIAGKVALEI
ncbi:NADPH:quinone oxidoreductase family protein [Novosphingobium sediminicola]|uniref:NADPH2:quinone reductase n=1 Tax=Novosphingobium sediminicola TaxID=563162 RepID=A0A7W6CRE0_9SPHN|nr:NADPH:quinone oxidoreductase family protein [Novosphingobium sediminicola]MBB3957756.1 NADPH2:quinone reductase [Novosphingobium sediminicola]